VPEFTDPVFAKTSPKRSFPMIENERFGLVFARTGSINLGTVLHFSLKMENIFIKFSLLRMTKIDEIVYIVHNFSLLQLVHCSPSVASVLKTSDPEPSFSLQMEG
jgi:hypothetical protein